VITVSKPILEKKIKPEKTKNPEKDIEKFIRAYKLSSDEFIIL